MKCVRANGKRYIVFPNQQDALRHLYYRKRLDTQTVVWYLLCYEGYYNAVGCMSRSEWEKQYV